MRSALLILLLLAGCGLPDIEAPEADAAARAGYPSLRSFEEVLAAPPEAPEEAGDVDADLKDRAATLAGRSDRLEAAARTSRGAGLGRDLVRRADELRARSDDLSRRAAAPDDPAPAAQGEDERIRQLRERAAERR